MCNVSNISVSMELWRKFWSTENFRSPPTNFCLEFCSALEIFFLELDSKAISMSISINCIQYKIQKHFQWKRSLWFNQKGKNKKNIWLADQLHFIGWDHLLKSRTLTRAPYEYFVNASQLFFLFFPFWSNHSDVFYFFFNKKKFS